MSDRDLILLAMSIAFNCRMDTKTPENRCQKATPEDMIPVLQAIKDLAIVEPHGPTFVDERLIP